MSSLKGLKELLKNLIFSFLTLKNIRMLLSIIDAFNIGYIDPTISIFIKFLEALSNFLLSSLIHWSSDSSDKLVEFNETTAIKIKVSEKLLDLALGEAKHVISHSFCEFIFIKRFRIVVIHDLELSLETDETSSTS